MQNMPSNITRTEIDAFFQDLRNLREIEVGGYFIVSRKDSKEPSSVRDNIKYAIHVDFQKNPSLKYYPSLNNIETSDKKTHRVYYLKYRSKVPQSLIDSAFEYVSTNINRIVFQVSRTLDVMIDREGNLIFLKNRCRGFIQQDLVNHFKAMPDTFPIPGGTFKSFFDNYEEVAQKLSTKLANDPGQTQYFEELFKKEF